MAGKGSTHCPQTIQLYHLFRCFLYFLWFYLLYVVMFSGSAVLWWLTVILQVSEQSRWSKRSTWFHKRTVRVVLLWCHDRIDPCTSLMLSSSSFLHAHTQLQVRVCCCSLDVLHSQCVQIILANNFLFPVSDSGTSCSLSCTCAGPKRHN